MPYTENKGRKDTPFTLPDNYFEEFHEKLMQQLPAKGNTPSRNYLKIKKVTYWMRAAAAALLLTAATTTVYLYSNDMQAARTADAESNEMIETIFDSYPIDDYNVYCYLTATDANF